ncbi:uncharacterized protein [Argopecten irradians]|uniref:uncharacterized protein n=1 Tax=Argopecten irradians TaxID=31199 RepID=UPI00371B0027
MMRLKRHLVVILGIIVIIVVLGLIKGTYKDTNNENDVQLRRLVRSLHSLVKRRQTSEYARVDVYRRTVSSKVPWLQKHADKFLPNVYLRKSTNISESSLVFLQQEFSKEDGLVHTCLSNIAYTKDLPMSPLMHVQNRLLWDAGTKDSMKFKEGMKIHRGPYSFGACDNLNTRCAHFILMHDPLTLAISGYDFCNVNPHHERCYLFLSQSISLKEWILLQKGALFYHLLFTPEMCSHEKSKHFKYLHKQNSTSYAQDQRNPCWYRQKLMLGEALSDTDVSDITSYMVKHLSDWFAVVGLASDVESSLLMFEKAFDLPFTKCHRKRNSDVNNTTYQKSNGNRSNKENTDGDNRIHLRDDKDVQEAMLPDLIIYKEAKRLFHIQQQILLNKV